MRYAVITDIHANFPALRAVDDDVKRLRAWSGETIDYWFLGDLVGYGPQPVECVRWLRFTSRVGERWVAGNHDEWLILPDDKVHPDAVASLERHQALLNEPENEELGAWFRGQVRAITQGAGIDAEEPRSRVVAPFDGVTAVFVHASAAAGMRRGTYLYPWENFTLADEFRRLAQQHGTAEPLVLFCGHTHYPMWARYGPAGEVRLQSLSYRRPMALGEGLMIINPGSVGQPRDGDTRAAYLLFDPEARTVEFRRVDYDVMETVAALDGYPEELAQRLLSANGGLNGQQFAGVYRRPGWDLEAVGG